MKCCRASSVTGREVTIARQGGDGISLLAGYLEVVDTTIRDNTGGSWYALPGISMHDDTTTDIVNSTIE